MISYGSGVIFHFTHQFKLQYSTVKVEKRSSLESIPGIEQKCIRVLLPYLFNKCCPSCHSTHISIPWIVWPKRFNMAVYIVSVQDGDMLCLVLIETKR